VGQDRRIDRLSADYAAAKAESQRIWQWLQTELRAGTPPSELARLEDQMWAAMHRLEKASQELSEGSCAAWKRPARKGRRVG
jgi:hypothetical protein